MIRAGTTRFWDMYWFQFDVARAFVDSGMRGDREPGVPRLRRRARRRAARGRARRARPARRVRAAASRRRLGPHAIYTVDEPTLRFVAELAAARGVPVQIHLSETEDEVRDCVAAHGCRPAEYLDRIGLLTERTVLAHGVWLDAAELDARRRTRRDRSSPIRCRT